MKPNEKSLNRKSFLQHVAHLFRGQLLFALAQWTVLAMLTRFGGKVESGKYVLMLATTAPIFMFADLNLRVVRSTDHQFGEQFRSYVALRVLCLIVAVGLSFLICGLLYPELILVLTGIILFRFGESLSNLAFGGYQRVNQSDKIGKSLTFKGIFVLLVVLTSIVLLPSPVLVAFLMGSISLIWALLVDLPQSWKQNEPDLSFTASNIWGSGWHTASWRIARRALPMGFDSMMSSLALNMPRYCIDHYFGRGALGIFGVLAQLAFSIQLLIGAVGHTGVSLLANCRQQNEANRFWRLFNRMMLTSLCLGLLATVGGTLVIPPLMKIIVPDETEPIRWLVFILLTASTFAGVQRMAGRATQACGKFVVYTAFDLIIFVVSAIAAIQLVPQFKLEGGAAALSLAFLVGLIVTLIHTYLFLWPSSQQTVSSEAVAPTGNSD